MSWWIKEICILLGSKLSKGFNRRRVRVLRKHACRGRHYSKRLQYAKVFHDTHRKRTASSSMTAQPLQCYGAMPSQSLLTSRVARRWTLSMWFISAPLFGELASIAYSWWSNIEEVKKIERWPLSIDCLVVFAASLQCTDEMKFVSRGTPGHLA